MKREIIKDDAILGLQAEPATAEDAELAQDILDTMGEVEGGCACLAANQIGVAKAIIAYCDDKDELHVMYNPKLMQAMKPFKTAEECLSRDEESKITRFQEISVVYEELVDGVLVKRKKKFRNFTAQAIQHGIDHCKGRLV